MRRVKVSKYARCARSVDEQESWIRRSAAYCLPIVCAALKSIGSIPLSVMMYEGIAAGVLDYDYAPQSMLVSQVGYVELFLSGMTPNGRVFVKDGKSRRIWMNVSQEGKAAIDDLREQKLLNGLKLSSEDFQPITAFQISTKGMDALDQVPQELFDEVNTFIMAPKPYQDELLQVVSDSMHFLLLLQKARYHLRTIVSIYGRKAGSLCRAKSLILKTFRT